MVRKYGVALCAALVLCVSGSAAAFPNDSEAWDATEPHNRRIMVIGDSLIKQSAGAIEALATQREHAVNVQFASGTAPCDWTARYGGLAAPFAPDAVAFAFIGNATTDCMTRELGWRVDCCLTTGEVAAVVVVYRKHLTAVIRWNTARGIESWLTASPVMGAGTFHGQITGQLNAMLADLAADEGPLVHYSTTAQQLLAPTGAYTGTIAGLPVRHPDKTHLRAPYGTTLHATGVLAGPMTGN